MTFVVVAVMSVLTIVAGSYIATRSLQKKQIASVLKGL